METFSECDGRMQAKSYCKGGCGRKGFFKLDLCQFCRFRTCGCGRLYLPRTKGHKHCSRCVAKNRAKQDVVTYGVGEL